MKLTLIRTILPDRTLGVMTADNSSEIYYTIERQKYVNGVANVPNVCCIPTGEYDIEMQWSEHFQEDMPHLQNVPHRTDILIHGAATPANVIGCIGVNRAKFEPTGQEAGLVDATHQIRDEIKKARAAGEKVSILITEEDV